MTVREYLVQNPSKSSYTIKVSGKQYLCNLFDANAIFGNKVIKHVGYRLKNKNMPILTVL